MAQIILTFVVIWTIGYSMAIWPLKAGCWHLIVEQCFDVFLCSSARHVSTVPNFQVRKFVRKRRGIQLEYLM